MTVKQEMVWNSQAGAYFGITSSGRCIRVDGIEYAEAVRDGVPEIELLDPDIWEMGIGINQNIEYVDSNE